MECREPHGMVLMAAGLHAPGTLSNLDNRVVCFDP